MANVVTLAVPSKEATKGEVMWRKRQAIQIAAQLPEDREAALAVLDYARELIDGFLAKN